LVAEVAGESGSATLLAGLGDLPLANRHNCALFLNALYQNAITQWSDFHGMAEASKLDL
jgi:hypothetical protein